MERFFFGQERVSFSIETLEKIKSQLSPLLKEGEATDGEVYVHGWTFQRIISAIKRFRTILLSWSITSMMPHIRGFFLRPDLLRDFCLRLLERLDPILRL